MYRASQKSCTIEYFVSKLITYIVQRYIVPLFRVTKIIKITALSVSVIVDYASLTASQLQLITLLAADIRKSHCKF